MTFISYIPTLVLPNSNIFPDFKVECTIPNRMNRVSFTTFLPGLIWKRSSYLRNISVRNPEKAKQNAHVLAIYQNRILTAYFSACPQASPLHRMSVTTREELRI